MQYSLHGCVDAGPTLLRRTRPSAAGPTSADPFHFSSGCWSLRLASPPSLPPKSRIKRQAPRPSPELKRSRAQPPAKHRPGKTRQGQTSRRHGGVPDRAGTNHSSAELHPGGGFLFFVACPDIETAASPPSTGPGWPRCSAFGSRFLAWHTRGLRAPRSGLAASRPLLNGWPLRAWW